MQRLMDRLEYTGPPEHLSMRMCLHMDEDATYFNVKWILGNCSFLQNHAAAMTAQLGFNPHPSEVLVSPALLQTLDVHSKSLGDFFLSRQKQSAGGGGLSPGLPGLQHGSPAAKCKSPAAAKCKSPATSSSFEPPSIPTSWGHESSSPSVGIALLQEQGPPKRYKSAGKYTPWTAATTDPYAVVSANLVGVEWLALDSDLALALQQDQQDENDRALAIALQALLAATPE